MGLRLTLIATAAIIMPAVAGAQAAAPDQAAQQAAAVANVDANAQAGANADSAKPASKAEVKAGATVYDSSGKAVGKIDSVDGDSAVLNTGKVQVKIPVKSIARDDKGLAIGMTKSEVEAAASKK